MPHICQRTWCHQMEPFSALLAICEGNSPVSGEFPHKGQWRGALVFSLICARINDWVNNGDTGDLRRFHTHYDVTVMSQKVSYGSEFLYRWLVEDCGICKRVGEATVVRKAIDIFPTRRHFTEQILLYRLGKKFSYSNPYKIINIFRPFVISIPITERFT